MKVDLYTWEAAYRVIMRKLRGWIPQPVCLQFLLNMETKLTCCGFSREMLLIMEPAGRSNWFTIVLEACIREGVNNGSNSGLFKVQIKHQKNPLLAFGGKSRKVPSKPGKFFVHLVTMDKIWIHHFDPEPEYKFITWKRALSPMPRKFKVSKSAEKLMSSFFREAIATQTKWKNCEKPSVEKRATTCELVCCFSRTMLRLTK